MAKQNQVQMPGVFGGLMRYDEEYKSRFMISPSAVVGAIIGIIVFVLALKLMFPVANDIRSSSLPGFLLPLLGF